MVLGLESISFFQSLSWSHCICLFFFIFQFLLILIWRIKKHFFCFCQFYFLFVWIKCHKNDRFTISSIHRYMYNSGSQEAVDYLICDWARNMLQPAQADSASHRQYQYLSIKSNINFRFKTRLYGLVLITMKSMYSYWIAVNLEMLL